MSNSVQPQRRQPTRLPRPWDSPGKNTGVGCHFLLQCMEVKSESEFAQLCPTLSDPMDCSLPSSSVHGIFQARVLEWGAIDISPQEQLKFFYLNFNNFCIVENGVIADLIIFITVVSNHSKCIHYASHHIRNKCLIFFLPTPHAP